MINYLFSNSIVAILAVVCGIWVIYDVLINQKKLKSEVKFIWIICAILFSIFTAIVYYFFVKMKK